MLAVAFALVAIPLGRILDVAGARLMLDDPETTGVTAGVARQPFWPPDLLRILQTRSAKTTGTLAAELTAAAALALVAWRFADPAQLAHGAVFATIFLFLAYLDLRERVVPNLVVLPASALAVVLAVLGLGPSWRSAIVGGASGLVAFAVLYVAGVLVTRRMKLSETGIGMGDVKLAALIGLVAGWPGVINALFAGVLIGGLVSGALVVLRRVHLKSYIPYAPFLLAGGYLALLLGGGR